MGFEGKDNTDFEDNIREMILAEIGNIKLNQLNDYALANQDTLRTIYGNGILNDENIKEALRNPVTARIWDDYKIISNGFVFENLPHPELIAYALEHDVFSEKELKLIPLEPGDTLQKIIDRYRTEDLFDYLKEKLLNPTLPCYEV
ncbi:MAG: hypothetical protein KAI18_02560 [Candidatus Aenigmarchaeota archaeon]|nr:hypothetical protein [Candidatus Aenigmarchaeota archaeon]